MKFEIVFALLFFFLHIMNGQNGSISVQIDKDTLYLDEAQNCGGNFELPVFDNFEIIGGPNVSSSLTIINGVKSQKMSYSFQLLPIESGDSEIPGISINCEGSVIQTETIPIRILSKKNREISRTMLNYILLNLRIKVKTHPIVPRKKEC
ncbi:MAG: BatD family protein [Saprospiraceae bacterium]|nr:BatD family protein [Saprospiraceae bacterium]